MFQLAAERLAVAATNCVVVEDAPSGIQAAHAAGMKVVAIASTGRTTDELKSADIVVKSLRSLSGERFRKLIAEAGAI